MSFESFHLHPSIMSGVRALGYVAPTPIQLESIPPILQGRDFIGLAQTGTGKTAAFVLPVLERLLPGPRRQIRALVISPTRELAEQICETVNELGRNTGLRGTAIYGGVGAGLQTQILSRGVDIVVACPGRLLDHIWQGTIDLSHVELLVIDEADRMFDMGFLPDIRNILKCLMRKRQTMLFSATMPDDIRRLVKEVLSNPVTVQVDRTAPAATVSHTLYPVKQNLKTALLKDLLRKTETDSVLIFTRTKHRARRVAEQLQRDGFKAASLQGNLSQCQRQAALDGFRSGSIKVLVATDIAARGIDVLRISHVVNYDMPDTTDAYTHRIGRTGRIGKTGDAFTFVTGEDTAMVRALEQLINARLERRHLPGFNYDVAAETAYPAPLHQSGQPGPCRNRRRRNN
jgi:ATP-dependent RNA helicase RhlE